jgi:flagellar motor switch protein FliG
MTMPDKLQGVEKAAVLLLSLGAEAASDVMRHLDELELRKVSQALARVHTVAREQVDQVHQEFETRLTGQGLALTVDGKQFARTAVSKALADQGGMAAPILAELDQVAGGDIALNRVLEGVPPDGLAKLLEVEHPQVAALILAHLTPNQGAEVITLLPETMRGDIVERLARLDTVPTRLAAEVGAILQEQVKDLFRPAGSALGGPKAVAEMLNHADKTTEASVFEEIERNDPELVAKIRGLMFTFEDCMRLDNRSLQTLLKEVAREDLLLALKTANPALCDKIFANVSSRAAEILKEDMSASGPVRLKDVEAAQARVIATLRELEAEGKVVIAGGGKDDVLV